MKMKRNIIGISAGLLLLAMAIAGCGGGGGGSTTAAGGGAANTPAATYGKMGAAVNFGGSVPARFAATGASNFDYTAYASDSLELLEDLLLYQDCGDFDAWLDSALNLPSGSSAYPAYVYVTPYAGYLYNSWYLYYDDYYQEFVGPVASACTYVYADTTSARVSLRTYGEFEINNVMAGTNHLVEAVVFTGSGGEGVYVAGIVPEVFEGAYSEVAVTPESTLVAVAALTYADMNYLELGDMDPAVIQEIEYVVSSLFPNGISYGVAVTPTGATSSVTFTDYSSFSYEMEMTTYMPWSLYVLDAAGLYGGGSSVLPNTPTIVNTTPGDTDTNVAYDGTSFTMVFDQTMDTASSLAGFSVTIQNASTGGTITIDDLNVSSYGTFAWSSTYQADDTLTYTLNSNTALTANSLKTMNSCTTYMILNWIAPMGLVSLDGMPLNYGSIPFTGNFTTACL